MLGLFEKDRIYGEIINGKTYLYIYFDKLIGYLDDDKIFNYLDDIKELNDFEVPRNIDVNELLEIKGIEYWTSYLPFQMKYYARYMLVLGEGIKKNDSFFSEGYGAFYNNMHDKNNIPKDQQIFAEVINGRLHIYLEDIFRIINYDKKQFYFDNLKYLENLNYEDINIDEILEKINKINHERNSPLCIKWYAKNVLIVGEGIKINDFFNKEGFGAFWDRNKEEIPEDQQIYGEIINGKTCLYLEITNMLNWLKDNKKYDLFKDIKELEDFNFSNDCVKELLEIKDDKHWDPLSPFCMKGFARHILVLGEGIKENDIYRESSNSIMGSNNSFIR